MSQTQARRRSGNGPVVLTLLLTTIMSACETSPTEFVAPNLQTAIVMARQDQPFYYYQGSPILLDVDPTRLVVASSESVILIARQILDQVDITSEEDLSNRAPGHRLLKLSDRTSRASAEDAANALRADSRIAFVSNVYGAATTGSEFIPLNQVIVRFEVGTLRSQIDSLVTALGSRVIREPVPDSGWAEFLLAYPPQSTPTPLEISAFLDRHPLVQWADPDALSEISLEGPANDPYYSDQFYLKNSNSRFGIAVDINIEPAWDLTLGSSSIRLTVIDDGLQSGHSPFDLGAGGFGLGYDAFSPACAPCDYHWSPFGDDSHGTSVGGIIFAKTDNLRGVAGIAPYTMIQVARIIRNGSGASAQAVGDAINWAWSAAQSDVLSNSWRIGNPSNHVTNAINSARTQGRGGKGTVVVFSAGNSSNRQLGIIGPVRYPANLSTTIAVGAINRFGFLTNYTAEGPEIDIVAPSGHNTDHCVGEVVTLDLMFDAGCNDGPGGDIFYTSTFSGTSAAAPQVAAVAALLLAREPGLTASQVEGRLYSGADNWGPTNQFGNGKLNAYATLYVPPPPPPLSVSIIGPTQVPPNKYCAYQSQVSGGTGSYSYQWYRNSNPIGTGPIVTVYTGDVSSFIVTLDVEDTGGADGSDQLFVTVSSQAFPCFF